MRASSRSPASSRATSRALHEPFVARNARLVALLEAGDRDEARTELMDYLATAERQLLDALS